MAYRQYNTNSIFLILILGMLAIIGIHVYNVNAQLLGVPDISISINYVNASGQYSSTTADGGDLLKFMINITNTGTGDAYNVTVNNTINSLDYAVWAVNLDNVVAAYSNGTVLANGTDILIIPYPNATIPEWVNITLLRPIPPGLSVIINYTINIYSGVITGSTYWNEVNVTRYSDTINGPSLTPPYPFSSATIMIYPPLVTSVDVIWSSEDFTGLVASVLHEPYVVSIGELVIYEVNVTVPEGITNNMTVEIWLPALYNSTSGYWDIIQVEYVGNSNITVNATGVTASNATLTPGTWNPVSGYRHYPNIVDFLLGDINNSNSDNIPETISIRFYAVVLNMPNNTAGVWPWLGAVVAYYNSSGYWNCPQCPSGLTPYIQTYIVEPNITVTKTFNRTTIDNIDSVAQIDIRIVNVNDTYTSPAFDMVITDIVPGNLTVLSATYTASGAHNVSLYVSGNNVTITLDRLDVEGEVNVTIIVSAYEMTYVNTTIYNTVVINASSLPGNYSEERYYTPNSTASISYLVDFKVRKRVNDIVPDLGSWNNSTSMPPGGVILYKVTTRLPLGFTPELNIVDPLDPRLAGPIAITVSSVSASWDSYVIHSTNPLNITFYNVTVNDTWGYIAVRYRMQILNTTSDGDVIINTASVTVTDGSGNSYTKAGTTTVYIREPDLRDSMKWFTPDPFYHTNPFTVLYINISNNGTWPAYDVVVMDNIPPTLLLLNATIDDIVNATGATLTYSGNNITLTASEIGENGYIVIKAWVRAYAYTPWNSTTLNTVEINWSSISGDYPGEKLYNITRSDDVYYDPVLDGVKVMGPSNVTIGTIVTAVINVTIPTGNTSSLSVIDTWDPVMSIVGAPTVYYPPNISVDTVSITIAGNSLTIDFGGVSNNDTVPLNITIVLQLRINYLEYDGGPRTIIWNNASITWNDDGYLVSRDLGVHSYIHVIPVVGGAASIKISYPTYVVALGIGLTLTVLAALLASRHVSS